MQLGFSFEEVKQIADLFDQYKEIIRPHNPSLTLNQVTINSVTCCPKTLVRGFTLQALTQFANLISLSVPENLKLIAHTFNLLEMGYTRQEVARLLAKERRRVQLDATEMDVKLKRSRTASPLESNGENFLAQESNGNQSDDEV
ncbi:unnamed protein product [Strongylus vulgaris]|uniref:Uncharacterized protein n=1 Tax=Strongylus vulgaris TaxID=40348 RepID=A0A3P7KLB1_STRVU|nr:unnamed protein product [Strongylus vulgaris]